MAWPSQSVCLYIHIVPNEVAYTVTCTNVHMHAHTHTHTHTLTSMTTDWKSFSGSVHTEAHTVRTTDMCPQPPQNRHIAVRWLCSCVCVCVAIVNCCPYLCWEVQGIQHVSLPSSSPSSPSCSTLCRQQKSLVSSHLYLQATHSLNYF